LPRSEKLCSVALERASIQCRQSYAISQMSPGSGPFDMIEKTREVSLMPTLIPISQQNVEAFKRVRLEALRDSPTAFGSTYAAESQFTDAQWIKRAANLSGKKGAGFLAMEDAVPCGIIGALFDEQQPEKAQIVSMWVAPAWRRTGLGRLLIDAIRSWARSRGVHRLNLMVTSCNQGAVEFYRRCGFAMTGNTEPYPNDSSLFEYEMAQSVPAEEPPERE
jgi:GNAT superfamily N-acetyltransferase